MAPLRMNGLHEKRATKATFDSLLLTVASILNCPGSCRIPGELAGDGRQATRNAKADDGDRTRDPQLGKLMLYQLSYVRIPLNDSVIVER